jgi:hypothetical protein
LFSTARHYLPLLFRRAEYDLLFCLVISTQVASEKNVIIAVFSVAVFTALLVVFFPTQQRL